jgi:hypothetical protein
VTLLALSGPGGRAASCDSGGVIKVRLLHPPPSTQVWSSTPAPTTLATFISGAPVTALAWLGPTERYFLYGTALGQVRLCDVAEKTTVGECLELGPGPISVLRPLPAGTSVLCCSAARLLLIGHNMSEVREVLELQEPLTAAAPNHNGSLAVHGDASGRLGVTDLHRAELLSTWTAHSAPVEQLRLAGDETSVWSLGRDGSLLHCSLLAGHPRLWAGGLGRGGPAGLSLAPEGGHCLGPGPGGRGSAVYRLPGGAGGSWRRCSGWAGRRRTRWPGGPAPTAARSTSAGWPAPSGSAPVVYWAAHFRPTVLPYVPCLVHSV